jgi:hypothetical protein
MKRSGVTCVLVVLAALQTPLQAQSPTPIAGCYLFNNPVFMWTTSEQWSATQFSALSALIELRPEAVEDSTAPRDHRRVVVPGIRDSVAMRTWYRHSHWKQVGTDSVGISWWSGLYGQALTLRVSGDSLVGVREYLSDIIFSGQENRRAERPTVARRIPCPTPRAELEP